MIHLYLIRLARSCVQTKLQAAQLLLLVKDLSAPHLLDRHQLTSSSLYHKLLSHFDWSTKTSQQHTHSSICHRRFLFLNGERPAKHVYDYTGGLLIRHFEVLQARLYADVLLSGYYVLMNAYGWYYWLFGGKRTSADVLPVTRTPRTTLIRLGIVTVAATFAMGWWFDNYTQADLAYWDSTTTCFSFAAMWMTARKYLENWIVWLGVDILATGIYLIKGI